MLSLYTRFQAQIIDRPFMNDAGVLFEQTAVVSLLDRNGHVFFSDDYGYVPTGTIYDWIEAGKHINLDKCFVKNFSLTAYRRSRLIYKKEPIRMFGFSACKAVFHSLEVVDFSYVDFGNHDVRFVEAFFSSGTLNFHGSTFGKGIIDFNSSVFRNGTVDFSGISKTEGDVIFRNTRFGEGEKNFQHASFGPGIKSFSNADFGNGYIRFINTHFGEGRVSFKLVNFGNGQKDFHFSSFGNDYISFESANFGSGDVNFSKVEMGDGMIYFNRARFNDGELSFEGCIKKKGKFLIKWVNFGSGNINFERIEMPEVDLELDKASFDKQSSSRVSFNRASVKRLSLRSCHLDDYFDLRVCNCEYMDLSNTVVRDIIDLKTYDYTMNIGVINMAHMRMLGIIDVDWKVNKIASLIKNQTDTDYWIKAEQFRILKENFNNTGRYADEDKAYVAFKRYENKAILATALQENKWSALWEYPYYGFKTLVFDRIGLYATEPLRVLLSIVVVYTLYSFLYVAMGMAGFGYIDSAIDPAHAALPIFAKSFYFSAITFFTIGYGDFYPMGWFRLMSPIEGFMGLFLMSYFTVAFVRKILR